MQMPNNAARMDQLPLNRNYRRTDGPW